MGFHRGHRTGTTVSDDDNIRLNFLLYPFLLSFT